MPWAASGRWAASSGQQLSAVTAIFVPSASPSKVVTRAAAYMCIKFWLEILSLEELRKLLIIFPSPVPTSIHNDGHPCLNNASRAFSIFTTNMPMYQVLKSSGDSIFNKRIYQKSTPITPWTLVFCNCSETCTLP